VAIVISAFMTNGGTPYSSYTPTISIWRVSDNSLIISSASMVNVASSIYKYDFTTFIYGVAYVYLITGDSGVPPQERYQWGNCYQEIPDRTIGTVQTDAGNSATQFKASQTNGTADYWKDALCIFLSGNLTNQVKKVTAYNGTSYILSFTNGYTGTPANGDTYALVNF